MQAATTQGTPLLEADRDPTGLELKFYSFYVNDVIQSRSGLAARPCMFSRFRQELRVSESPITGNEIDKEKTVSASTASTVLPHQL